MLGWPEMVGILIGFVLVVAYCYAGGIRASIWTDAVQSCVMIVGSGILCWIAIGEVGGFSGLHSGLEAQSPALTNLMPPDLRFGVSMWALAFFLGGLAVAGQPQVVSRVMTLGSDKDRKQAMIWFFVWQTPFVILMTIIGLASRVLFSAADFDAELSLPMMAMETMPAIGVGMILASIFAATMSTADSQVLACTAAITDDIKPEWREDHKTTKKVTLVVAAFATMISIGGLYIPGGDSVFTLVVLAVYGLGGIFVPLLIIRWMGYTPDTNHSLAMMVAAFVGVIGWSIVGFSGADGIFPSVPGMGAAFIVHFVMNQTRTPDVSPFGRYAVPDLKKMGAIAATIIVSFCAFEVTYLVTAPDSSDAMGGVGEYTIDSTLFVDDFADGSEYVMDGETLNLDFNTNSIGSWENGDNVVGVRVMMNFGEDETSGGSPSCALTNDAPDTVTGTVVHDEQNQTFQGDNQGGSGMLAFEMIWYNSSLAEAGNVSGMSESEIHEQLDVDGAGLGVYSLEITVEADSGGGLGCQHSDDGEEVGYAIQLLILDYSIDAAS